MIKRGDDLKIILLGCFQAAAKLERLAHAMKDMEGGVMNGRRVLFFEQQTLVKTIDQKLTLACDLYTGRAAAPRAVNF
jgi:hypothetical protein